MRYYSIKRSKGCVTSAGSDITLLSASYENLGNGIFEITVESSIPEVHEMVVYALLGDTPRRSGGIEYADGYYLHFIDMDESQETSIIKKIRTDTDLENGNYIIWMGTEHDELPVSSAVSESVEDVPTLEAIFVQGVKPGYSLITAVPAEGNTVVHQTSRSSFPRKFPFDTAAPASAALLTGEEIALRAGEYIALFEINAQNIVQKYMTKQITSDDVKPMPEAAPTLDIEIEGGSARANSIKIKFKSGNALGSTNRLVYEITDTMVTGRIRNESIQGKTPYSLGSDITNIQAGGYITVYEITQEGALVKYTSILIAESMITKSPAEDIKIIFSQETIQKDDIKEFIDTNRNDPTIIEQSAYNVYSGMSGTNKDKVLHYMIAGKSRVLFGGFEELFTEAVDEVAARYPESRSPGGSNPKPSVYPSGNTSGGTGAYMPLTPSKPRAVFKDLDMVPWAAEAIEALKEAGIIAGATETEFKPSQSLTREEFVKLLVEMFRLDDNDAHCNFSDVAEGAWYYKYVSSASKAGITNGISTSLFGIGGHITREQMSVMLFRAVAAAETRITDISPPKTFNDSSDISVWAVESVSKAQRSGIMVGNEYNEFNPKGITTRAEAAVALYNLYKQIK